MDSGSFVKSGAHSRGFGAWFITWNTKYRYKMLEKREHFIACEQILQRLARIRGWQILALSVMPCTVQLVVVGPHNLGADDFAFILKGASAHELNAFKPAFKLRYPKGSFWARGYDAYSVSPLEMQKAIDYVHAPHNDPRQTLMSNY